MLRWMENVRSRRVRNFVMLLLLLVGGGGRLVASVTATATLTVTGAEQQPGGVWDSGNIMVSFNGFLETINYARFSTPASLASGLAAMFSRDYYQYGLSAKAGAHANTDPTVITFDLTSGQSFGAITDTLPSTSFALVPSGFGASGSGVTDTGTVTLQVNGVAIGSTNYASGATPATIAQALALAAASNTLVTVTASGGNLYLQSKATGSSSDYPFTLTAQDTAGFTTPSFQGSPASDSLSGGADGSSSGTSTSIYSYGVGYDPASNITSFSDLNSSNPLSLSNPVMGAWTYSYDSLNRLSSAITASGPYVSQTPYFCWDYDSFGNRNDQALSNQAFTNSVGSPCQAASGASFLDTVTTPGANNQITSATLPGLSTVVTPSYDGAGNVLSDGVNSYLYDAEGRLCAVHGALGMTAYQYDADGNRVGKGMITSWSCDVTSNGYQPTNDYVLDQSGGQMTEVAVNAGASPEWQHTNVTANGTLIATYDLSGLHFYLNDPLGSRRVQTDSAGVLEQTCLSLPFGDALNCTESTSAPTEHHFTGKERDTESGLDNFEARYYGSNMGRFMSPDPSGLYYANPINPQSLNLYSYGRNNPLINTDPTGKDCIHLNNDTGAYEGTDIGDCDNSTEEKANSGYYVDGTVNQNTIAYNQQTGNYGYQYSPYDQDQSLPPTIGSGVIDGVGSPITMVQIPTYVFNWSRTRTQPSHGVWHYGNYAGPGGAGVPKNDADAGAMMHDYCYSQGGFGAMSNYGGHNAALQACNQALCDTETKVENSVLANNGDFDEANAAADMTHYFSLVPFGNSCKVHP